MPRISNGGYSLIGAGIESGLGLLGTGLQYLYNKKLAEQQNELNIQQWERENEYNLPINQMARLKQAGLNPNLVYQNGANVQSARSPQMTSGSSADFQGPLNQVGSSFAQILTNLFSIKRQFHDERKAEADADKAEYDALIRRIDAMKETNDYYFDYQRSDDDVSEQENNNVVPVVGWRYGRGKVLQGDINVKSLKSRVKYYTDPALDWSIKNENLNLTKGKQAELNERVNLIKQQIDYYVQKTRYAKTDADLYDAYGEIDKLVGYLEAGANVILSIPNKLVGLWKALGKGAKKK